MIKSFIKKTNQCATCATGVVDFVYIYSWELSVLFSTIFLVSYIMFLNRKNKGTWSNKYIYHGRSTNRNGKYVLFDKGESKGEKQVRAIVQRLFKKPFIKCRPEFLRNDVTQNNLELDCYNADLKLAFEYNGRQHYEFVPHFHKNKEAFRNQQYRDVMKHKKCQENGITLITIPYTVKHIEEYIRQQLPLYGFFV